MQKCEACGQPLKQRTERQNRAYFGLAVQKLADHYGYEKEVMHKALAGAFFGFNEVKFGGASYYVPASTKGRSTKEFKEYYEYIQKIAAERGIDIQSPNEPPLSACKE